jgi:hypothetical protein
MEQTLESTSKIQTQSILRDLSVAESLAELLSEIRSERQEVQLLQRESRKRINRGVHVTAASTRSVKLPALW